MITMTRSLEIDAGHRLMKHEGKCRSPHGHRYRFDITVTGDLDDVGRVVDFSEVKRIALIKLDELDHAMILQLGDPLIPALEADMAKLVRVPFSPTIENLVIWLARVLGKTLPEGLELVRLVGFETPTCSATWERLDR